jgi:hypothetical protein
MEPSTSKIEGTKDKNACSKSKVKSKARHVLATDGPKELSLAKAQLKESSVNSVLGDSAACMVEFGDIRPYLIPIRGHSKYTICFTRGREVEVDSLALKSDIVASLCLALSRERHSPAELLSG